LNTITHKVFYNSQYVIEKPIALCDDQIIDVAAVYDVHSGSYIVGRRLSPTCQIIVKIDDRIMALTEGILAYGGIDNTLLDVFQCPLVMVEADHLNFTGKPKLLDGL